MPKITKQGIREGLRHSTECGVRKMTAECMCGIDVIKSYYDSQIKKLLSEIVPEVKKPALDDCDCQKGEYEAIQKINQRITQAGF